MSGSCTRCGACCLVIPLTTSKTAQLAQNHNEGARHRRWLRKLRRLTPEEAVARLPTVVNWSDWPNHPEFVYKCLNYDEENKACTIHDDRPDICRGFPWYKHQPDAGDTLAAFPKCGFWPDADQSGEHDDPGAVGVNLPAV